MRTRVVPATDCSHLSRASLLSWSLSAPLPILPLLWLLEGLFELPLEPWVFPTILTLEVMGLPRELE